jgi:uncharacterized membrane protein
MNIKEIMTSIAERIDRAFLISPSFYAVISGAFIGVAANLFTGLISIQEGFIRTSIWLAIFSLLVSSGSFLYICIVLEPLQESFRGKDLRSKIETRRKRLWPSAFVGCASFIMGVILLARIV